MISQYHQEAIEALKVEDYLAIQKLKKKQLNLNKAHP